MTRDDWHELLSEIDRYWSTTLTALRRPDIYWQRESEMLGTVDSQAVLCRLRSRFTADKTASPRMVDVLEAAASIPRRRDAQPADLPIPAQETDRLSGAALAAVIDDCRAILAASR